MYLLAKDSGKYFCTDYSQHDPSTLDGELIGKMISTYEDNQLNTISSKKSAQETQHVTLNLESVEKFIYHIKQGVKANSLNLENEKLKLRIYYAAYPEAIRGYNDLMGIEHTDAKRLTAVMFPVRENENNEAFVFDPFEASTYEGGLLNTEVDAKVDINTIFGTKMILTYCYILNFAIY